MVSTTSARAGLPETVGTIVAYRAFVERDGYLHAVTPVEGADGKPQWQRWAPQAIVDARCDPRPGVVPHLAPAPGCRCGVNACDSLATLRRELGQGYGLAAALRGGGGHAAVSRDRLVIGVVQMWSEPLRPVQVGLTEGGGAVIRAPFARLVALAEGRNGRLGALSERYRVPVVPERHLEVHARNFYGEQLRVDQDAPGVSPIRRILCVFCDDFRSQVPWFRAFARAAGSLGLGLLRLARPLMWPLARVALRLGIRISPFAIIALILGTLIAPQFGILGRIEVGAVAMSVPILVLLMLTHRR